MCACSLNYRFRGLSLAGFGGFQSKPGLAQVWGTSLLGVSSQRSTSATLSLHSESNYLLDSFVCKGVGLSECMCSNFTLVGKSQCAQHKLSGSQIIYNTMRTTMVSTAWLLFLNPCSASFATWKSGRRANRRGNRGACANLRCRCSLVLGGCGRGVLGKLPQPLEIF